MITKPTVIILGAGASIPYGFPSGLDLIDYILTDLPESENTLPAAASVRRSKVFDVLRRLHGLDTLIAFRRALGRSGKMSIDAFLESNPLEIREVGKAAIALEILAAEDPAVITRRGDGDWYRYFYTHVLACDLHQLTNNRLTIITYNYDRSLEYFLVESFAADCSATPKDAAEVVTQLPILHLHGSLGPLPDFSSSDSRGLPYGSEFIKTPINTIGQKIKVISDPDVDRDVTFKRAHAALEEASRIYFMGFGWAPENLRRLIPDGLTSGPRAVLGTTYGMGTAELQRAFRRLTENRFSIQPQNCTCLEFLREFAFDSL